MKKLLLTVSAIVLGMAMSSDAFADCNGIYAGIRAGSAKHDYSKKSHMDMNDLDSHVWMLSGSLGYRYNYYRTELEYVWREKDKWSVSDGGATSKLSFQTQSYMWNHYIDFLPYNWWSPYVGAGIGLFIAFIGFKNGGIIVNNDATLVGLGDICHSSALLAIIGIVITGVLLILKVPGNILIGIIVTALLGMLPVWQIPGADGAVAYGALTTFDKVVDVPPTIAPIFCQFQWSEVLSLDMIVVLFTFLFIDMFDTIGTVIGVSQKAGMVDEKGNVNDINKIFMADAVATTCGSCLGTSTTTTYVESAAGVGAGGRTGLTSFTTVCCFALALFFAPIFTHIPSAATTAALVIVGLMMLTPIKEIDLDDFSESIPAFLTIILMPLCYSISDGILIGMISYVVINALCGKFKKISVTMWILAILFIARYLFL